MAVTNWWNNGFVSYVILNSMSRSLAAFITSAFTIVLVLATVGAAMFPMLVPAELYSSENGLSIYNSSSSYLTLKSMLIITAIGMPLVLGYTTWVHRIFRGTVEEVNSY